MPAEGLDHINIVSADIGRTVAFYEGLLGLEARPIPVAPEGYPGRWIYDKHGRDVIHVQVHDPARHGALDESREKTGALDHIAIVCTDFDGMRRRCEELGLDFSTNHVEKMNFSQIFVRDPDHVMLELNFRNG
jgi:catechol 2,3-dioxygenase-like lactoylglutathione lyase family enzyme